MDDALFMAELKRSLSALSGLLERAATSSGVEALPQARLVPDMLPLCRHVQIAVDGARGAAVRLAGRPLPAADDPAHAVFNRGADAAFSPVDDSFAGLLAYVEAGRADLEAIATPFPSCDPGREIQVVRGRTARVFRADAFMAHYMLPNLAFHVTIVYALLRQAGVAIGKGDYEGPPVYRLVENGPDSADLRL